MRNLVENIFKMRENYLLLASKSTQSGSVFIEPGLHVFFNSSVTTQPPHIKVSSLLVV